MSNKLNIMNIVIKQTNELNLLSKFTKTSKDNIGLYVSMYLVSQGIMYMDESICGYSIGEILDQEKVDVSTIVKPIFNIESNFTLNSLIRSLTFFGDDWYQPCKFCGLEKKVVDAEYEITSAWHEPPEYKTVFEHTKCYNEYCKSKK